MTIIFIYYCFFETLYSIIDVFSYVERAEGSFIVKFGAQCITIIFLLTTGLFLRHSGKGRIKLIGLPYMLVFTFLIIADTYVLTILGDFVMDLEGIRNNWNFGDRNYWKYS